MSGAGIGAVLFDLDGTLVDTAEDLLGALDDLRAQLGLPPCADSLPPAIAARGGRGIIALGFPDDAGAAERYLASYLRLYQARIAQLSRPYPGIEELLAMLEQRGIAVGIVTNKPEALARELLTALGWHERAPGTDLAGGSATQFGVLVGGDTLPVRKPAPDPIWEACKLLGVDPASSIMVGDDLRDIASARAAGCAHSIAVSYGYIEDPRAIGAWGADSVVATPAQLSSRLLSLI